MRDTDYGIFEGDTDTLIMQEWVIDPDSARVHVGHLCTVSIYAGRNLAIECEDCGTIIGDIDFLDAFIEEVPVDA